MIGIGVGLLPAPRRRREHRAEDAQVDLSEPGPLLEAPRTQYDRREEDAEVRKVEHDALRRVAPDILLVAHGRGGSGRGRGDGVQCLRAAFCGTDAAVCGVAAA